MKIVFSFRKLFVVLLLCLSGCSEDHSRQSPEPVVFSPLAGSLYFTGEAVRLHAEVAYFPEFSHMEIYLNDIFLFETDQQSVDTLIQNNEFSEGLHVIKVSVLDNIDNIGKCEVNFQVEHSLVESKDMESFGKDQTDGWSLSGWSVAKISADDDERSLCSSSGHAVALTTKSFVEAGSVSFFVKSGAGKLEFWVDGELKSKWFEKDVWGYYGYSVPAGTHVFRWVSDTMDTYIDRVEFTPGLEQHSLGEIYGGGTIIHLDSTGLHGLIAAFQDGKYDGNFEISWGCYGLNILSGNRALSNTNGEGNTWAIVEDCSLEQIAARYCFNFTTFHGNTIQDDWYLPAIMELNKLYLNQDMLEGLGGQYYWSSTSTSPNGARVINFLDGSHHGAHRNIPNITGPSTAAIHVRPIRSF